MDLQSLDKRGQDNGLWYWNLKARKIHFSPGWVSMLGFEPHEIGDAPEEWFRRIHPEDLIRVQSEVDATVAGKSTHFISQHRLLHKEGTYRWMSCRGVVSRNRKGRPVRLAGFHSDVTAQNAADALTGLPKRLSFLAGLEHSIARAIDDHEYVFAVLLLNIDHFSSVAERLGPRDADQLLIAVARRLEASLGAGAAPVQQGCDHVVARLGGNEFAIRAAGNTVVPSSVAKDVAGAARSRILFKLHRKERLLRTAPLLRDSGNMRSVETGSGEPHRSAVVKTPEPQEESWVEQRS